MTTATNGTMEERARRIASECRSYLESAAGEVAMDAAKYPEPDVKKKIAKAKKAGVRDIEGWLADEFYNDAGFIEDFLGVVQRVRG